MVAEGMNESCGVGRTDRTQLNRGIGVGQGKGIAG